MQSDQQSIKIRDVLLRKLEPGQEVERLRFSQIATVMQPARDGRRILQPDLRVVRLGFEYLPPLVLRKRPPLRILPIRNQDRTIRLGTAQRGLPDYMKFRYASNNDLPITEAERKFRWERKS